MAGHAGSTRRQGSSRLRALRTLAAVAGLLLSLPAEAGESSRGQSRDEAAVVVDAAGQRVGIIVGADASVSRVAIRVGNRVALVGVTGDRFFPEMVGLVFESPDCTGPAWLEDFQPDQPSLSERVAIGPGNVLLAATGPQEERTLRSIWLMFNDPPSCDGPLDAFTSQVLPAARLLDLGQFVPPFRPRAVPRGTPGSAGRRGFGPAVVVDASGQRIGSLQGSIGIDGVATMLEASGRTLLLTVTGNRVFADSLVGFEHVGCAGQAWLLGALVGARPLFDPSGVGPGQTLYGADGPPASATIASLWDNNTFTPGCVNGAFSQEAVPAVPMLDLNVFSPPFGAR